MVLPPGGSRASYSIVLNRLLFFFGLFILHMHDLGSRFAEKSEKSLADKTLGSKGIARQQWRARIETSCYDCEISNIGGSPASNGGRGLKQKWPVAQAGRCGDRPPAMAGAD